METLKLLRLLPTLVTVGMLSYAAYSINGLSAVPANLAAIRESSPGSADLILTNAENELGDKARLSRGRDPFTAIIKAEPLAGSAAAKATADSFREIVHNLDLNATFIQGKAQYAVINGRMYQVGQHLNGAGAIGSLVLTKVAFHDVTLTADGKSYTLGYPDRFKDSSRPQGRPIADAAGGDAAITARDPNLALLQMLLRSPLGIMGRSMLGAPVTFAPVARPEGPTMQASQAP